MNTLLVEHSLRLYRRYELEVVEALNLCPWAKRTRESNQLRLEVLLADANAPEAILESLTQLATDQSVEVALLLLPKIDLGRTDFEQFVAALVQQDAMRYQHRSPPFAFAAFHPDAKATTEKPDRLIPFWRRSPDPSIQLVRLSALERVRKGDAPGTQYIDPSQIDFAALLKAGAAQSQAAAKNETSLRQRIAEANFATFQSLGQASIEATFREIAADRRRARDALGLSPSVWERACG